MPVRRIDGTIDIETARSLRSGDQVLYTGRVYTARDAAHARLVELLDAGKPLPFDAEGAIVYYAGPAPAKPGQPIGSVGPTTSYRMDPYAPRLLDAGLRAMIGKGMRSKEVIDAIMRNSAVYFAAVGGAAALIAKSVQSAELVCYEDLGTEAIRLLTVQDMPLTVAIDCRGGNIYESGPAAYLANLAVNSPSNLQ
ncbi:MAG: Fe-S-containing hydro-lyase [Eggerthellaceae bacterium]|nr:Fe-S-containing hydro-lyase [Eggerthellaceae bacterium]